LKRIKLLTGKENIDSSLLCQKASTIDLTGGRKFQVVLRAILIDIGL